MTKVYELLPITLLAGLFITALVPAYADNASQSKYGNSASYVCENGKAFSATYEARGNDEYALLVFGNDEPQKMDIAISGSGTRYVGQQYEWHVKAKTGVLTKGDEITVCTEEPVWSSSGLGPKVTSANCTDCDEDIEILATCNAATGKANLIFYALAAENGEKGDNVRIDLASADGETSIDGSLVLYGLVGMTPVVSVDRFHEIWNVLRSRGRLNLKTSVQSTEVALHGAASAIDNFIANCFANETFIPTPREFEPLQQGKYKPPFRPMPVGFFNSNITPGFCRKVRLSPGPLFDICAYISYLSAVNPAALKAHLDRVALRSGDSSNRTQTTAPRQSQTVAKQSDPQPNEDGLFWFTGDGSGKGSPRDLQFAIPETDARVFYATCFGHEPDTIHMEFYAINELKPAGSATILTIEIDGEAAKFEAVYFSDNEEYAGVRTTIPTSDPVWGRFTTSDQLSITLAAQQQTLLDTASGRFAIAEFMEACGVRN
ncbi:hypothetical protein R2A130_2552 [Ahrensia sp. R2A130]|nr:hypothetical protein R2A130_2552 [Ahrensia sp. R2A130]